MTIDERLERLGERMDAMAMNLELTQRQHDDRQAKIDENFDKITHTFEIALDAIKRLENIASAH